MLQFGNDSIHQNRERHRCLFGRCAVIRAARNLLVAIAGLLCLAVMFPSAAQVITPMLGTASVRDTGTSGATVPLLSTANTWADSQNLTTGKVLSWNADTGISRDAAGVFDFGNGTQGNRSATLKAVGIGLGADSSATFPVVATSNRAGNATIQVNNNDGGTGSYASFQAHTATTTMEFGQTGDGFTPGGAFLAAQGFVAANGTGGLLLTTTAAQPVYIGVNAIEIARFVSTGLNLTGSSQLNVAALTASSEVCTDGSKNLTTTGCSGGGPQFRINRTANQTGVASATATKVAFDTKVYDTATICDVVTNNRCTPNVAGKYHIIVQVNYTGTLSVGGTDKCLIEKNGAVDTQTVNGQVISTQQTIQCSADIVMNGTTDYVEGFVFLTTAASTGTVTGDATQTFMSGFLE